MDKKENRKFAFISFGLLALIVGLVFFVIIPKYSPVTPAKFIQKIDFSNPTWIEQYVEKSVGIYGIDFYQSTAFSYTQSYNKMVVTYVSKKSVEEVREYYLSLPGAKQSGRNDETSLNITVEKEGQILQVYNYYSPIARVIELELTLDETNADKVISQVGKSFPVEELEKIPEIKEIISGQLFGGYVRYQYDHLDEFTYPDIPIFSRAYIFDGSETDYRKTINSMNEAYLLNKYDETQDTYYFQINEHIISLSNIVTDSNDNIVTVGIQKRT